MDFGGGGEGDEERPLGMAQRGVEEGTRCGRHHADPETRGAIAVEGEGIIIIVDGCTGERWNVPEWNAGG
jgi:hypothetical protein